MKDDFGYFGSGLEGYVQYNEAFKRNFDRVSPQNSLYQDSISDMESEDEDTVENDSDNDVSDDDSSDGDKFSRPILRLIDRIQI